MPDEEIEEKLKKCSTYDRVPDLIALPEEILVQKGLPFYE